jgi:hypothetical protein
MIPSSSNMRYLYGSRVYMCDSWSVNFSIFSPSCSHVTDIYKKGWAGTGAQTQPDQKTAPAAFIRNQNRRPLISLSDGGRGGAEAAQVRTERASTAVLQPRPHIYHV